MSDFKLVAIRPREDCNPKFLRILKPNILYSFYDHYKFSIDSDGKEIVKETGEIIDLYNPKNSSNPRINISAIVGENGSGKSSLVELFFVACYNLSVIHEVLRDQQNGKKLYPKDRVKDIHMDIFYAIENKLFLLEIRDSVIKLFEKTSEGKFKKSKVEFSLLNFFYTIAINYSHHSLNSKTLGTWINKIFHKNDGYQTPVVLNPFRIDGIIDINNEEYLVRSRFLSNILGSHKFTKRRENNLRNIVDDKVAHRLHATINKEKFEINKQNEIIFPLTKKYGDFVLPMVFKFFKKDESFRPKDTVLNRYAIEYILRKIFSIAERYYPYKSKFSFLLNEFETRKEDLKVYLKILSTEDSHVTFKLRQAINFLSNELYFSRGENFDLTIPYLSRKLNEESELKGKELIDILPPPFFDVDIEFKDGSMFNELSSGEKQRVYSISTLIYHIINLHSTDEQKVYLKYKYVNIVFDELELYFHPELQRKLISDILINIRKLEIPDIKAINILLITHSPFVLSDIPESNILFLNKQGKPEPKADIKTFGGNIHELLAHSFFLKNGFIGEFAKQRINEIIDFLRTDVKETEKYNSESVKREIQMIGEQFLRQTLLDMYYKKYDKRKRIEELRAEIAKLEKE